MPWDETENQIRFKITVRNPELFITESLRTEELEGEQGVSTIAGKLEDGDDSPVVQAYLFDKQYWDMEKAREWLKEHDIKAESFSEEINDWITVFRAGDYTDAGKGNWGEEVLDKIIENYDPAFHESPLVVGHPKADAPAYGWVEKIRRVGRDLQVKFREVAEEFKKLWGERRFNKLSVKFYYDLSHKGPYLQHVGAIGAAIPEVKGLPQAIFKETSGGDDSVEFMFDLNHEIEFSDKKHEKGVERTEIEKPIQEAAEKALAEQRALLTAQFGEEKEKLIVDFDEKLKSAGGAGVVGGVHALPLQEAAVADDQTAQFSEEVKQRDERIAELEQKIKRKEHGEFTENLIRDGKLLPVHKDRVVEFMLTLNANTVVEFSEGSGCNPEPTTKKKEPQPEAFKSFLLGMPKIIEFSELSRDDSATMDFAEKTAGSLYDQNQKVFEKAKITREEFIRQARHMKI